MSDKCLLFFDLFRNVFIVKEIQEKRNLIQMIIIFRMLEYFMNFFVNFYLQLKISINRGIFILGNYIYVISNDEDVKMSQIYRWNRLVSVVEYKYINLLDFYQFQIYYLLRQLSKFIIQKFICVYFFINF